MTTDTITTEAQAKTDEMIVKIGKLLAQAKSAAEVGNEAEANIFTDKAFKLMAQYDISAAMVTNTTGEVKDELTVWDYKIEGDWAIDQSTLFFDVTSGVGAKALRFRSRVPGTRQTYIYTMRVWGYQSQIKRIEFLFKALLPQMIQGSLAASSIVTWESKRSYRKSWMAGFGSAISVRLWRARQAAVQEANEAQAGSGTSAELVLADKNAKAKSFFDEANTRVVNGRKVKNYRNSSRKLSGSGNGAGYRAGERASFGDNTIGGGRRALGN